MQGNEQRNVPVKLPEQLDSGTAIALLSRAMRQVESPNRNEIRIHQFRESFVASATLPITTNPVTTTCSWENV